MMANLDGKRGGRRHGRRWLAGPWIVLLASAWLSAACRLPEGAVVAAATRPVESNSPDPVQTGVVQLETGWGHTFLGGGSSQDGFNNLIKLGVWCNAEIRWSASTYNFLRSAGTNVSGMGDNALTAHYRLFAETRRRPGTAVSYTIKLPSGNPGHGLGSGEKDHIINLMLGKTAHRFSAALDAFYFFIGQGEGHYNTKEEATLAISHPVWRRWSVIGEIYGDSRLNASNKAYGNSTWVLTYSHSPRLIFDGGASVALTSGPGAPRNSAFLGVTYAVGNLYRAWNR